MSVAISRRLKDVPVSSVRRLTPYATAAKAKGVKILHLNIGDPDIKTPHTFIEALRSWNINPIGYGASAGEPLLLQSLAQYYQGLGHHLIQKENIVVTVGGSEAVSMILFAVAQHNEEVLVFEPFYSNYASCAALSGVQLVGIPADIKQGFHLPDKKTIEKKLTKKTRAILICTPGNPTGAVYTKQEMDMLVQLAQKHNLFLISDEVYREYIFDNASHVSLLSYMKRYPRNTIVLDSLSKRYSLCGIRIGAVVSLNPEVMKGVTKIAQSRLSAGLIDQIVSARLTRVPASYIASVKKEYQKRRDVLYSGLRKIPGVFLSRPEGAFYTMVQLPVQNAEDFAIFLLEKFRKNNTTVMLAPGNGFYLSKGRGVSEVRIAHVLNTKQLKEAIDIVSEALSQYLKK